MQLFFFTFFVLLLAFLGMAVGVIFGKKELKGSCGGISNIPGMKSDCSCASPCEKRKAKMAKEQQSAEAELDTTSQAEPSVRSEYSTINLDQLRSTNK